MFGRHKRIHTNNQSGKDHLPQQIVKKELCFNFSIILSFLEPCVCDLAHEETPKQKCQKHFEMFRKMSKTKFLVAGFHLMSIEYPQHNF